jgi:hypothetical protein
VVTVLPADLEPGVYEDTITIQAAAEGSPQVIAVTLVVTEEGAQQLLTVHPLQLELTGNGESCTLPSEPVAVDSQGAPLTWAASESIGWLNLEETSGATPDVLSITCDATGMAPGRYSGQINVTAPGSLPQVVTVQLTVGTDAVYLPVMVK